MKKCKEHPTYKAKRAPTTRKKCNCREIFFQKEEAKKLSAALEEVTRRVTELTLYGATTTKPIRYTVSGDKPFADNYNAPFIDSDLPSIHPQQRELLREAGFSALHGNRQVTTWVRVIKVGNFEQQCQVTCAVDRPVTLTELISLIYNSGVFNGGGKVK